MLRARLEGARGRERPHDVGARGDRLDETLEDTFPASDPIPHSPTRPVREKPRQNPPPN